VVTIVTIEAHLLHTDRPVFVALNAKPARTTHLREVEISPGKRL